MQPIVRLKQHEQQLRPRAPQLRRRRTSIVSSLDQQHFLPQTVSKKLVCGVTGFGDYVNTSWWLMEKDDLEYVERSDVQEVDWDLFNEEEQHRGRFLYSLLSTLLQGLLLSLVRNCGEELETLKQLVANCQPKARNRTMSMLQGIMGYPAFNMKSSIIAQVVRLVVNSLMRCETLLAGSRASGGKGKTKGKVEEQRPEGQGQSAEPSTLELHIDYLMDIFIEGQKLFGPSANEVNAGLSVKRISTCADGGQAGSHVTFDMRSSSASSWEHVKKEDEHVRMVRFFYIDKEDSPLAIRSATTSHGVGQNYKVDNGEANIIIDSGADAPVFPISMIHCGLNHDGQAVALQEVQGRQTPLAVQRSIAVVLEDVNGVEIELLDNGIC
eukprot:s1031_g15.t1